MRRFLCLLGALVLGIGLASPWVEAGTKHPVTGVEYVGSQKCSMCHKPIFNNWKETLHAKMVRPAKPENIKGDLTKEGAPNLKEFDFAYVLGGWYKEERYVIRPKEGGFQVTPNEWNQVKKHYVVRKTKDGALEFQNWLTDCVGCHTTGYEPAAKAFNEVNIACESCHGPGGSHVKAPKKAKLIVDKTAEACGQCHIRGKDKSKTYGFPVDYQLGKPETLLANFDPIPMTDTASIFPDEKTSKRHRQQYLDWMKSKHATKGVGCVACHDPHKGPPVTMGLPQGQLKGEKNALCLSCHEAFKAKPEEHSRHTLARASCVDCHMPRVIADGTLSTHTFKTLTPADTLKYGVDEKGRVKMPNSCTYKCHQGKDATWAQEAMVKWGLAK